MFYKLEKGLLKDNSNNDNNKNNNNNKQKQEAKVIPPCILKYSLVVFLVVVIIWLGTRFTLGINDSFYIVVSESMVPNLNKGDMVVINHNIPFNGLKIGDIIVFTTPGKTTEGTHKVIIHRVADIIISNSLSTRQEEEIIRTKGDANPASIALMDYPIKELNYIGKVVFVIPKIGLITVRH